MKGKPTLLGLGAALIIYLLNPVKKDAVVLNPLNQPEKADKSTIDAVVQGNYAPHINGIRIDLDSALAEEYTSDDFYYTWRLYTERAAKAPSQELKAYNEDLAIRSFNEGYRIDMEKSSFYEILKEEYIDKGLITEIKPGGLDAVKDSVAHGGRPVVILYVDSNYANGDISKRAAIISKNLFELCGGREERVDYKFIDVSKWPGYNNVGIMRMPAVILNDNVKGVPALEIVFRNKSGQVITDVFLGGPEDRDETYEILADTHSNEYLVDWVTINTNINDSRTKLYRGIVENKLTKPIYGTK